MTNNHPGPHKLNRIHLEIGLAMRRGGIPPSMVMSVTREELNRYQRFKDNKYQRMLPKGDVQCT